MYNIYIAHVCLRENLYFALAATAEDFAANDTSADQNFQPERRRSAAGYPAHLYQWHKSFVAQIDSYLSHMNYHTRTEIQWTSLTPSMGRTTSYTPLISLSLYRPQLKKTPARICQRILKVLYAWSPRKRNKRLENNIDLDIRQIYDEIIIVRTRDIRIRIQKRVPHGYCVSQTY